MTAIVKPHLIMKSSSVNDWPGAMEFFIRTPDQRMHWLNVDSWSKVAWYLKKLAIDPEWPCGIDMG